MGFQQGLSGLNAASKNLDVIGNNVSNAQTSGFKVGQAQFADVFAASLAGSGASPVGIGTKLAAVMQQFTQGNITTTNNPLDVAINGGGFFVVQDKLGSTSYTRNGQFQLDKNGNIVTNSGYQVVGYQGDPVTGSIVQTPAGLNIPKTPIPPQSSTAVKANLNFDAAAKIPSGVTVPASPTVTNVTGFNYADPLTYNNTTSATVYDSTGAANSYSMYFVKVATNTWNVYSVLTNSVGDATPLGTTSMTGGTTASSLINATDLAAIASASTNGQPIPASTVTVPDITISGGSGILTWNDPSRNLKGAITAQAPVGTNTLKLINGTGIVGPLTNNSYYPITNATIQDSRGYQLTGVTLRLNKNTGDVTIVQQSGGPVAQDQITFGVSGTLNSTGSSYNDTISQAILNTGGSSLSFSVNFGGSTQYSGSFGVNTLTQDGYGRGLPAGFNIGADGIITGRYTNGQTKQLGQFLLGRFPNAQGLQPIGNNLWNESSSAGQVVKGTPGTTGDFGLLQSSSTEDSNVDLTAELVNMITAQRVYQANAQTIKTVDAIMQTLINLR